MLNSDVLSDLNRTVNHNDLSSQIKADINATIGMNRLSSEVTEKLNQEKTTNNYNAPSVGSLLAVPSGSAPPAGYSLYQRGEPKELVWEEKAPVSVARYAYDGVEVLDGKIYFVGGGAANSSAHNIAERYDPVTNTWETLASMSISRRGVACAVLNGKLYAIGGIGLSSVEIFDPSTESWSTGVALSSEVRSGTSITAGGKIYLIGGHNASGQNINLVLCFDPSTNQWSTRANMPTARSGVKLVWFENRIWAIAGYGAPRNSTVESYDPQTDTWRTEKQLPRARHWPVVWVSYGRIYVGGKEYGSHIDYYDRAKDSWIAKGNLPENKYVADAAVLNDQVYVIGGATASGVYSNKVFAADLNASVEGVYDLYRKDGDSPVGTPVVQSEYADGSVTASKLDTTILKYLKPEISAQPQAQTVYADSNISFSVTAEGKYLTYQWKKDGSDLTGETNATLNITDANATLHDGNYSVVVSNDFGSMESGMVEVKISDSLLNGLVGWWKFDEGSGTVAYDSSGNGHDGNLTNGPTWVAGKIEGALSFDGVNDWVNLGADPFPDIGLPNQAATFSIWFKIQTTTYTQTIFSDYTGTISGDDHLVARLNVGASTNFGAVTRYAGTNYEFGSNQSNLMNNSWNAATYVMDPSINLLKLYINGSFDSQNQYIGSQNLRNGSEWTFGASQHSGSMTSFLKGLLDDARVYDRALSAEEVQALYNLGQ
jgi:N-acetylneuraminic acid mutarotase